jgi:undecaprenyl-diphosphatase
MQQSILLGAVQGICEYVPISSTAHLLFAENFMGLVDWDRGLRDADLVTANLPASIDCYNLVIQWGSILAVAVFFRRRLGKIFLGIFGRSQEGLWLLVNLSIALFPTAAAGFLLADRLQIYRRSPHSIGTALAVGGIYLLLLCAYLRRRKFSGNAIEGMTFEKSLAIGFLQCLALFPGMSRSLMTITGGLLLGFSPAAALEFSFLLGFATLCAALIYQIFGGHLYGFDFSWLFPTILGCVAAFLAAIFSLCILIYLLRRRLFWSMLFVFGLYRIAAAAGIFLGGISH